jgi:hypothetical protein
MRCWNTGLATLVLVIILLVSEHHIGDPWPDLCYPPQ